MGGVANKCAEVDKGSGNKPLEDADSEQEEGDEEEDDEDDIDDPEQMRMEAERALNRKLVRGNTETFVENIAEAKAVGVDEDMILKAEAILEQHREGQRREAFETELRVFLEGATAADLSSCLEMKKRGTNSGASGKAMQLLDTQIKDLEMSRALDADEVLQAKRLAETCTRQFLRSCVKGRDIVWVDLNTGTQQQATLKVDLLLRSLTAQSESGFELASCRVAEISAKRAINVEDMAESNTVIGLASDDRANLVAICGAGDPWLLLESSRSMQNELIMGLAVLAGVGLNGKR